MATSTWTCHICQQTGEADSPQLARAQYNDHYLRHHNRVPF